MRSFLQSNLPSYLNLFLNCRNRDHVSAFALPSVLVPFDCSAKHCFYSSLQFAWAEWLYDIIVGAYFEPLNTIRDIGYGGQHDDWSI